MFRNAMPRYEILSPGAMATLDKGWRRLVSEIGVEFMSDRALELFRKAGQKVEDNNVRFDPDFLLEQVAKAPREFDVQARNPANSVHIGGDAMVWVQAVLDGSRDGGSPGTIRDRPPGTFRKQRLEKDRGNQRQSQPSFLQ